MYFMTIVDVWLGIINWLFFITDLKGNTNNNTNFSKMDEW